MTRLIRACREWYKSSKSEFGSRFCALARALAAFMVLFAGVLILEIAYRQSRSDGLSSAPYSFGSADLTPGTNTEAEFQILAATEIACAISLMAGAALILFGVARRDALAVIGGAVSSLIFGLLFFGSSLVVKAFR